MASKEKNEELGDIQPPLSEAEQGLLIHDSQDEDIRVKAVSNTVVLVRTFAERNSTRCQ